MNAFIPCLVMMTTTTALADWSFSGQAGPYINDLGVPSSTVTQSQKVGTVLDLKLNYKFDSPWRFKSDLLIRTDFVARDPEESFQFMPQNFYLQRKMGSFLFKAGYQTIALDGPDIVNPADIVNPKNWIDPTSPITMGSPGLSLSQEVDDWNWEVFYVPRQTTPILPGEHSPWLPRKNRLPIESENTTILIPDNVEYDYMNAKELNNALNHNVTLKVQKKSENLETQLLYYNGLNMSPFLKTQVQGTLLSLNPDVILVDSPVKLQPLHYRQQAVAGTFLVPFESWAIRGGFNWLKPDSGDDLPKETTMMVFGFEKSFETSFGLVTGIVDYIRQERQDENQISFLRSFFEEAVSAGVRVPYGEETSFLAGGMYDLVGSSSLLKFSAQHRLTNSWSMEAGAQFLQGPDDTLIGIYNRHDSYSLKLMFSW
ncbi:MAG: hypothetical protein ACLGHN_09610 [Bacteriovoracia bacterium]